MPPASPDPPRDPVRELLIEEIKAHNEYARHTFGVVMTWWGMVITSNAVAAIGVTQLLKEPAQVAGAITAAFGIAVFDFLGAVSSKAAQGPLRNAHTRIGQILDSLCPSGVEATSQPPRLLPGSSLPIDYYCSRVVMVMTGCVALGAIWVLSAIYQCFG